MSQTHDMVVTSGELAKRYLSWERGEHRREWTVLTRLHNHLPDLVPAPLAQDLDAQPPVVTMSRLPGLPLSGTLSDAQLSGLERALRAMWSAAVGDLPARRYHAAEAQDVGRQWFAGATRPPGVAGEAFDAAAEFLSGPPLPDVPGEQTVIGHGDPNLANYLWDGERIRIVDFEDAGASDVAYELADLAEHLSARQTDWEEFLTRFDLDRERLRRARCLMAALWLHRLLPGNSAAHRNPPETLAQQAKRLLRLTSAGRA
ncbi:aminoglycoside phosphotransferase family protein [Allorhizocola rhizosphaerae]|uniref:aminoglycoside phosphotransferase family protein n=1 Tax=Allorhizocola rhizosphaerae TaxID=1872709 RepID=UPI000E3D29FD|nr:aminoglycoside phosphotransferase family protein [Allorhizocola rhizosphaerae]